MGFRLGDEDKEGAAPEEFKTLGSMNQACGATLKNMNIIHHTSTNGTSDPIGVRVRYATNYNAGTPGIDAGAGAPYGGGEVV
jgi:hypothetical protein